MRVFCGAVCIALGVAATVSAQPVSLTLSETLDRARQQSPSVLIALARIDESRARLVGASLRFPENPALDVAGGPRRTGSGTTVDFEVGFSQRFQTGGQHDARVAGAEAGIESTAAEADDARRQVMAAAARLYVRLTHAQARLALFDSSEQVASEVVRVATVRYEAGDIAILDVNLGRATLARARSARTAADADRRIASADLRRLIGMPDGSDIVASDSLSVESEQLAHGHRRWTGWATGSKTSNGRISSIAGTGAAVTRYTTILELAQRAGFTTGNVSTAVSTDATPAVLDSHIKLIELPTARDCQELIRHLNFLAEVDVVLRQLLSWAIHLGHRQSRPVHRSPSDCAWTLMCERPNHQWYSAGRTRRVNTVEVMRPPITTVASGRCTSAPELVDNAIGRNPRLATDAVMSTGLSRATAPSRTACSERRHRHSETR